jgi:hypothetical protein
VKTQTTSADWGFRPFMIGLACFAAVLAGIIYWEHSSVQHICEAGWLGDRTVYRTHPLVPFTCPDGTYEVHP